MTKEEHNRILNDLKSCTSDADRMNIIVQLERDYTGVLSERDTATQQAKTAMEESNKYAKLNNELWLQNSAQNKIVETTKTEDIVDNGGTEPPAKMTYEDLEKEF